MSLFAEFAKQKSGQILLKLSKERLNAGTAARTRSDQRKNLCDEMEIAYITTRELANSSGQMKGKIRIIVLKNENTANVDLTCPECGASQKKKEEWKMPFSTNCNKCGFQIKVDSLKKEIKKKK